MQTPYTKSSLFAIHIIIYFGLFALLIDFSFQAFTLLVVSGYALFLFASILAYKHQKIGLAYFLTIGIPLLVLFVIYMACINMKFH